MPVLSKTRIANCVAIIVIFFSFSLSDLRNIFQRLFWRRFFLIKNKIKQKFQFHTPVTIKTVFLVDKLLARLSKRNLLTQNMSDHFKSEQFPETICIRWEKPVNRPIQWGNNYGNVILRARNNSANYYERARHNFRSQTDDISIGIKRFYNCGVGDKAQLQGW